MAEETKLQWDRIEGVIIAEHLDPKAVADFINASRVIVAVDWYDRSPNLMGLTLAARNRRLATVNDSEQIVARTEFEDFAVELAGEFDAEVMIGDISADALPKDAQLGGVTESAPEPTRVVELTCTPSSSIPLLAALEDVDLAASKLTNGWHALAYDTEVEDAPFPIGDFPCVMLAMSGSEFKASLMSSPDPEEWVMYNWAMSTRTLAGGHVGDRISREAEELVGAESDLREIAQAVPGADVQAAVNSAQLRGAQAVSAFVRALGAPAALAEYLKRHLEAEEIPGVEVHDARGISNAIGRSVDKMLTEPESTGSTLWESYHKVAVERPWIVRAAAAAEASIGATLIIAALRTRKVQRTGWHTFCAIVGGLMLFDSVAEVSLAKYLGIRAERHRQRHS